MVGLKDLGESCVLKNEFSDVQFGIIYDYQVVKAGGRLKLVVNQKEMSANLYFSLYGSSYFMIHEFLWGLRDGS